MPLKDSKRVSEIEGKKGVKGEYWTITWEDGKKDNIFDRDWLELAKQSQKTGEPLHFTKEKRGNYYNIISLELSPEIEEVEEIEEAGPEEEDLTQEAIKMGAIPLSQKSNTSDNKSRAIALSYIKDLVVALINTGSIKELNDETYSKILDRAEIWTEWINKR